jgi:ribosomal protein S27E
MPAAAEASSPGETRRTHTLFHACTAPAVTGYAPGRPHVCVEAEQRSVMPIKITCPHCQHSHRFSRPYPMPGSEVQCGCGRVLVISFPADLMARLQATGAGFADPAPTPALNRHPVQATGVTPSGEPGEPT